MEQAIETIIYGILGLILMGVGYVCFDLLVPYNFKQELKEKNPAVGYIIAGIFIATAIIVRAAMN